MPRLRDILDESDRRMKGESKPKPKPPRVYGSAFQAAKEADEEIRKKKLKKKKDHGDISYDKYMDY